MKVILVGGIKKSLHVGLHRKIKILYGKANHCSNKDCKHINKTSRFEWALRKGHSYSDNIKDYMQLCVPCHRKYDVTDDLRAKLKKNAISRFSGGNKYVARIVLDTATGVYYDSVTEAAQALSLKKSCLFMMMTGKNPNKTNLIYA